MEDPDHAGTGVCVGGGGGGGGAGEGGCNSAVKLLHASQK